MLERVVSSFCLEWEKTSAVQGYRSGPPTQTASRQSQVGLQLVVVWRFECREQWVVLFSQNFVKTASESEQI